MTPYRREMLDTFVGTKAVHGETEAALTRLFGKVREQERATAAARAGGFGSRSTTTPKQAVISSAVRDDEASDQLWDEAGEEAQDCEDFDPALEGINGLLGDLDGAASGDVDPKMLDELENCDRRPGTTLLARLRPAIHV